MREKNSDIEKKMFRPKKTPFSIFGVPKLDFFVKQLPKRKIKIWENTPHKIVDHLGYEYQLSFRCGSLRRYILNFAQAPTDFRWNRGGFAL
jgi:hypothetical protein